VRHWVGVLTDEQFATERLYARESVVLPDTEAEPVDGDLVVLAAGSPTALIGQGVVAGRDEAGVRVAYRRRLFDDPAPVDSGVLPAPASPGLSPLPANQFARLAARLELSGGIDTDHSVWFVSLALPIEADSPAEAVRQFWTYVDTLGPEELPTYVWPLGDELAMQAFVFGAVANLDPEEDED
jgi:hypothetical protein